MPKYLLLSVSLKTPYDLDHNFVLELKMNKIVLIIFLALVSCCLALPQFETDSSQEEKTTTRFFKEIGQGAKKAASSAKENFLKGYDYIKNKFSGSKHGEIDVRGPADEHLIVSPTKSSIQTSTSDPYASLFVLS